jgi:choline dehydrogenase-like flavoprotein
VLIHRSCAKLGIRAVSSRQAVTTVARNGRPPCHYCGQCGRGCMTNSNFSSPNVLLFPAQATGRLTIVTNAMAREVNVNAQGLATGVTYVNTQTGQEEQVRARVVVLAASACESARIMLNSKSSRFPQGVGNSTGVVGKYLTDTTGADVAGFIPRLVDHVPHNCDGVGGGHIYMPWWLDNSKLDFPRGYHIEVWGGLGVPSYGFMGGIERYEPGGGYGVQLKNDYRRYYGSTVGFSGRGEQIPNADCYCELDPEVKDKYGIPVLRFHWKWTDHEINQVRHMQETFRALVSEMGGEVFSAMPTRERGYGIATGGSIIHELGTVRMGSNARDSALNEWSQAWDCRNLFLADGGPFVSQADKNPTWTIMAMAMRTSDRILELRRSGQI